MRAGATRDRIGSARSCGKGWRNVISRALVWLGVRRHSEPASLHIVGGFNSTFPLVLSASISVAGYKLIRGAAGAEHLQRTVVYNKSISQDALKRAWLFQRYAF